MDDEGSSVSNSRSDALKEQVRKGTLSERELIALYKNADRLGEAELPALIVGRMRTDFPRSANRLFGANTPEAVSCLEETYSRLSAKVVLASNKLGSGVKAGAISVLARNTSATICHTRTHQMKVQPYH